jgi:hypothetical protein
MASSSTPFTPYARRATITGPESAPFIVNGGFYDVSPAYGRSSWRADVTVKVKNPTEDKWTVIVSHRKTIKEVKEFLLQPPRENALIHRLDAKQEFNFPIQIEKEWRQDISHWEFIERSMYWESVVRMYCFHVDMFKVDTVDIYQGKYDCNTLPDPVVGLVRIKFRLPANIAAIEEYEKLTYKILKPYVTQENAEENSLIF